MASYSLDLIIEIHYDSFDPKSCRTINKSNYNSDPNNEYTIRLLYTGPKESGHFDAILPNSKIDSAYAVLKQKLKEKTEVQDKLGNLDQ